LLLINFYKNLVSIPILFIFVLMAYLMLNITEIFRQFNSLIDSLYYDLLHSDAVDLQICLENLLFNVL